METSDTEGKKVKWIEVQSANAVVLQEGDIGQGTSPVCVRARWYIHFPSDTEDGKDWKFSDELPCPTELMGILDSMLANSGYVPCPGACDYQVQFGEHV